MHSATVSTCTSVAGSRLYVPGFSLRCQTQNEDNSVSFCHHCFCCSPLVVSAMFRRGYASQDDFDDCLSRIVTLNDIVMTNLPRAANLESKFGHMTATQETMQTQLDRSIQRSKLLEDMRTQPQSSDIVASAPPLTAGLAEAAPLYTDEQMADSKPAMPTMAGSHRGVGSLPSPAGPGKFKFLCQEPNNSTWFCET